MTFWQPYRPNRENPWNEQRVEHLHRRAGFGATRAVLDRDLRDGFTASVYRVLGTTQLGLPLHQLTQQMTNQAVATESIRMLQAAWINEMCHGVDPLREQLALMWHNHFATSHAKVQSVGAMASQLQTFRSLARAPFGILLNAMLADTALLIYLDADQNEKVVPNENLARELMELFTLGVGNYSESDVKESARALTGWRFANGSLIFDNLRHDTGLKTVLGVRKPFDILSLANHLLAQSAVAERLAWRICDHFIGTNVVPPEQQSVLAEQLRENNLDIGKTIATVLRAAGFYDQKTIGSRFSSPITYVVANPRLAGLQDSAGDRTLLPGESAMWCRILGQELFVPPGVVGWPGGRTWLSPTTIIDRTRFAVSVAAGDTALLDQLLSIESHFD